MSTISLVGLSDGALGEKWLSQNSIDVPLWCVEERLASSSLKAPISRARAKQRLELWTQQELSEMRGVLGTASWSGSAGVSTIFHRCEFALECHSSATGARSVGRKQACSRRAAE